MSALGIEVMNNMLRTASRSESSNKIDLVPTEYHPHAYAITIIFMLLLIGRTYYITEIK